MQQIKMFSSIVSDLNEEAINEFLKSHKIISVNSYVTQGFTYQQGFVEWTSRPLLITTVIYDKENKDEQ